MTTEPADEDLIGRIRAGDREAYGVLVARYQGHVYGLAVSLVGRWAEAQDIAQETFIRAYAHLDRLRRPERFAAWLRRVAFSVAMNWIRAHRPERFRRLEGRVDLDTLEIPDFTPGPPEVVERRELARVVLAAVAELPSKYRVPLTMFHMDGLSYRKVADFLDIPLGTAQSLVHRARAKLRSALAQYVAGEVEPMVGEVFEAHKLPGGFARRVLENVPRVTYDARPGGEKDPDRASPESTPFPSCLASILRFLGEDRGFRDVELSSESACEPGRTVRVNDTYVFLMGVTGSAFRLNFKPGWHVDNIAIFTMDDDAAAPFRRGLEAVGYTPEIVWIRRDRLDEATVRGQIVKSIDAGMPVIAHGVVGPPEDALITGYDEKGEVLIGWSYFQGFPEFGADLEFEPDGTFRRRGWFEHTWSLVLVGERKEPPPADEVRRDALRWAVRILRNPVTHGDRANGLAAWDAWIEHLGRDEDLVGVEPAVLFERHMSHDDAVCTVAEGRWYASLFLDGMAEEEPMMAEDLHAAARHAAAAGNLMWRVWGEVGGMGRQPEKVRRFAEPDVRRRIVGHLREARDRDVTMTEALERAVGG
jgi:RNA polymerase sigma factor (sigma-70 family)